MNNETEIDGDGNIVIPGASNSTINVTVRKDGVDKKSSPVQKFYPKNFPASLIYFTGREQVLTNIAEALKNHGTAAFADTHGVGKSSVVIEFAHLNKESYRQILFIRATNNEFDIYVSDIVKELGFQLPEDAKPEQRLTVLQDWLAKNQDWLLLVDNVDDVDFIHKSEFNKPNGKVIYTSNDEKIFKVGTKVELPKMSDENAMLLLYKHWQDEADAKFEDIPEKARPALQGIAEKFGNHPFSMAFVGSYLAEEDESLEEFLQAYQAKEKNLLQTYEFLSNYQHKTVATAFLLRFEQISTPKDDTKREQFLSTAVKDYLKLSAYVGTDNIPEELLQQSLSKLHPDQVEWTENKDFIKEIYKRFKPTSIFKRDAENKTLTTHRIVQEIMRFQIKDEEGVLLKTLAEVLDNNFEEFDFINKEKVERYLSNVGVFLEYLEEDKVNDKGTLKLENELIAWLCNYYARYFYLYGQYKKAEKYCELFKNICEGDKNTNQNLLATSYNNLAILYRTLIKYEKAEKYFLKSINLRKQISTTETTGLAISYNQIGWLYKNLSKYEDAEFYYLEAVRIFEQINGNNHNDNCSSYNNLALLYLIQKRYEEAKPLFKKALEIRIRELGENHPNTAISYNNLALLYNSQGDYPKAEPLYRKALEIHERLLGENHPNTAGNYINLASLHFHMGNLELARTYQQKNLQILLANFNENHLQIAESYTWLGGIYLKEKKTQEAIDYFYKAREIYLNFLPEESPEVQKLQSYIDKYEHLIGK